MAKALQLEQRSELPQLVAESVVDIFEMEFGIFFEPEDLKLDRPQAVFGAWGVAQFWGCDDWAAYGCWNWFSSWAGGYWWYGDYCRGQTTRYGPGRYNGWSLNACPGYQGAGCAFSHRWGFKDRRRTECGGWNTGPNNDGGFFFGAGIAPLEKRPKVDYKPAINFLDSAGCRQCGLGGLS